MDANLPRRKFLQQLTGGAASLVLLSPATVFAISDKGPVRANGNLAFTDLEGLGPEINAPLNGDEFIALHEEGALPQHMFEEVNRGYVEYLLRDLVANEGERWDESDQILWTYQYYGFCDHSDHCEALLNYSHSAQDYLYNNVNGLLDVGINWSLLSDDFNYQKKNAANYRGLIGRYTYLVNRVSLVDSLGNMKELGLVSATPVNRAINYIKSKENVPSSSLMYLIPGNTSLMSPFSELLHLTTHEPSQQLMMQLAHRHGSQYANETSHLVGETITESAAILTAQQYLKKNRLFEHMGIINVHAKSLGRQYALMADAIAYMQLHGVQKTLSRFSENPLRLVKDLSHTFAMAVGV